MTFADGSDSDGVPADDESHSPLGGVRTQAVAQRDADDEDERVQPVITALFCEKCLTPFTTAGRLAQHQRGGTSGQCDKAVKMAAKVRAPRKCLITVAVPTDQPRPCSWLVLVLHRRLPAHEACRKAERRRR